MTLSFSTKWPGRMPDHLKNKPNLFIEKIHLSLLNDLNLIVFRKYFKEYRRKFKKPWDGRYLTDDGYYFTDNEIRKKHTIRLDPHNRWKAGNLIHPVINNRTPHRFQFAPEIPCVSTQKIEIIWNNWVDESREASVFIDRKFFAYYNEKTREGIQLKNRPGLIALALNDGFESVPDFFAYFNKDFTGKIIHWTDLKY